MKHIKRSAAAAGRYSSSSIEAPGNILTAMNRLILGTELGIDATSKTEEQ
jgi:hypothetical protein